MSDEDNSCPESSSSGIESRSDNDMGLLSVGGRTSLPEVDFMGHNSGVSVCRGKTSVEELLGTFGLRMGIEGLTLVDAAGIDTGNLTVLHLLGEVNT